MSQQNSDALTLTLVKSLIGTKRDHRATVRGLGLRRVNSVVKLKPTKSILGMIRKVNYLVKVEG